MSASPVVCAFDVNEPSTLAARVAAWLAEALQVPLELVYAFDAGELPALGREGPAAEPTLRHELYAHQEARARERAGALLSKAAGELPATQVSAIVREGRAVPVLQVWAAERGAALLVSGTAARRGLEHLLGGSVSASLAADAPCPVVVAPPDAAVAEPGPVLVGDDGSEHSRGAVRHATALAERTGRELLRMQVEDGDPVRAIADAGREHRACVVVVGTRGRGHVRAQLFGSVSAGLVRAAARPVTLVPRSAGDPS